MNSDLYCDILVNKLKPGIRNKRRGKLSKGVLFLHDNARPHTSCKTVSTIIKLGFEGKRFDSDEDVQKVVQDFFRTLPKSAYKEGIYKLPERWRRCIESQDSPKEGSIDRAPILQEAQNPTSSRSDAWPVATESTVHRGSVENVCNSTLSINSRIDPTERFVWYVLLPYGSCDPQLAIIVDTDVDLTCFYQGFHRSLGTLSLVPLRPFSCGVKSGFVVVSSIGASSSSREVLALARRWNPDVSLRKCRSQHPWLQGLLGDLQFVFPNLPSISTKMPRGKLGKTKTSGGNKIYFREGRTKNARRESQKLTREHDNTSWDTYIENLDVSDQTVWKAIRRLTAPKKEEIIVKTNNNLTLTAEEAAEALADSYEKQLSPNPPTSSYSNNYLNKRITAHLQTNNKTALEPTNIGEIKAIIDTFPKKKAPGIDGITNEALKLLPNHILESLTSTFNASLKLAYFPNNWKTSIICPILKQGKSKYDPASYRPISLLPVTSKLFERIILRRIKKALNDEHPLRPEQFGFQQKHSTLHQLVVVTEKIRKAMESKQLTGGIFFDISKAFDKVWHEALLYKMAKKNLPGDIIRMTKSFLCDRNLRVKVKDVLSTPRKIRAGVPQGSVIGPTFFNIFIDDYPCPNGMSLHLYADDAATLVSAFNLDTIYLKLQEALVFVNIWCDEWRVELNPQKTEAILFSDKRLKVKKPLEDLGYPDEPIKWKDSVRYLGVILDQHLTFQEHVQNRINLAKAAQHRLALFLGYKSKLSLHCKRTIYTSIIRPILTYGHPVFITANKTTLKKFESFENQVLKKIIGAPWFVRSSIIRKDLKLENINDFIIKQAFNFYDKSENLENITFREACNYKQELKRRKPKPRQLLYRLRTNVEKWKNLKKKHVKEKKIIKNKK
ncbi:hypothetical protein LAZ67_5000882 [Cordylochernes scorpioides]|uniref:Reverse transcriptase domain-containing protein n=1 Tax=Cordylochernes scorpioides TaxID=51811 RepID=A0ABY6KFA5_9ARAC|nr:hypothetical protein LAZ67_5000882 [Cordylochernes scorpioides]